METLFSFLQSTYILSFSWNTGYALNVSSINPIQKYSKLIYNI